VGKGSIFLDKKLDQRYLKIFEHSLLNPNYKKAPPTEHTTNKNLSNLDRHQKGLAVKSSINKNLCYEHKYAHDDTKFSRFEGTQWMGIVEKARVKASEALKRQEEEVVEKASPVKPEEEQEEIFEDVKIHHQRIKAEEWEIKRARASAERRQKKWETAEKRKAERPNFRAYFSNVLPPNPAIFHSSNLDVRSSREVKRVSTFAFADC